MVQAWINGVNPLVNFKLAADGTLTFDNAAVDAKASTPPTGYAISWSRFDNATGSHHALEAETTVPATSAHAPRGLEQNEYVAVTVKSLHPDRPTWAEPVRAYFRREGQRVENRRAGTGARHRLGAPSPTKAAFTRASPAVVRFDRTSLTGFDARGFWSP